MVSKSVILYTKKDRGGQKSDPFRFCSITSVYVMQLHWSLVAILIVLLVIQSGIMQIFKYGPTRIVNYHPDYELKVNGLKKLLKKIGETGDIAWKEGSLYTEENMKLVEEMIHTQDDQAVTYSAQAEIACELNTDCWLVSGVIDQDLDLCLLRRWTVQKITDSNIKKRIVELNTKVNSKCYCDVLLRKIIPEISRLAKHEYSCKTKLELTQPSSPFKQLRLLEPHHWPQNSPDFYQVDFGIWGLLVENIYWGRRITNLDSLKEAILEERNKILLEIIHKCIYAFKPRFWLVIEVEGRHIERYWLLIIHIDIPIYIFVKFGMILINWKKLNTISVNGHFFCPPLYMQARTMQWKIANYLFPVYVFWSSNILTWLYLRNFDLCCFQKDSQHGF